MNVVDIGYLISFFIMLYCTLLWLVVYLKKKDIVVSDPKPKRFPSLTFIIPAYNEADTIAKTIERLLAVNWPRKKIIVVDDGSKDETAKIAKRYEKDGIFLLRQKNAGKAAALNHALKHVDTELIACMDADSYPDVDYLKNMVGYFKNKRVAVVTPAIKTLAAKSMWAKIQWVEYLFQIYLRKIFSLFETQYVAPGPGSVYRTAVLKEVGGFDTTSMVEDMEVAFKMIDAGYQLRNSVNADVFTEIPQTLKGFYNQRVRWYRGYLQTMKKYWHMVGSKRYGNLGFFLLPMNLIWVFVMFFIVITTFFYTGLYAYNFLKPAYVVNDISVLANIDLEIQWFYIANFYLFFSVLFFVLGLGIIWLSVRLSRERFDLRHKKMFYIYYMLVYPLLISLFWMVSTIKEISKAKFFVRKW